MLDDDERFWSRQGKERGRRGGWILNRDFCRYPCFDLFGRVLAGRGRIGVYEGSVFLCK